MNDALAEKRDEKPSVLGVSHLPVEAVRDEPVFLWGPMQFAPPFHEYPKAGEQEQVAGDHRDHHACLPWPNPMVTAVSPAIPPRFMDSTAVLGTITIVAFFYKPS